MAGNFGKTDAASEQRRGNVTVGDFAGFNATCLKTHAGLDGGWISESCQEEIHRLCQNLRESPSDFLRLVAEIKLKFATDVLSFPESCDALVGLLYFSLLWNSNSKYCIDSVICDFIRKWFEYHCGSLNELIDLALSKYKISSFGSVILLYNHILTDLADCDFKEIINWDSTTINAQWLKEAVSGIVTSSCDLNIILLQSLNFSQIMKHPIAVENEYLKPLSQFFNACYCYRLMNYEACLKILSSICEGSCSSFLLGMMHLVAGLNLELCGKLQASLMNFKYSFSCSSKCWLSIYLTAKLFRKLDNMDACLEALQLLSLVNFEEEPRDVSFQGMLLNYHFPIEPNFKIRVCWLLGTNYLKQKNYLKAKEHYFKLHSQYPDDRKQTSHKKSLLLHCDQLPNLPDLDCVEMEYAITLMHLKEYGKIELIFKEPDETKFTSQSMSEISDLKKVVKSASQLLSAEASFHLDKLDVAIYKCSKLIFYFEMLSIAPSTIWSNICQLLKSSLYQLLGIIANLKCQEKNVANYKRLERQYMDLWSLNAKSFSSDVLSDGWEWIIQNIIDYYVSFDCCNIAD